jgi:hypothetical protein
MSDLIERAQAVKARWSMDAVIEQLIGEPVPVSRKINSPFNEADETPSFHVYDNDWYDYSTGKHGDVITLVRELRRCSFEAAIELLEQTADDLGLVAVERAVVEKPKLVVPALRWWKGLPAILLNEGKVPEIEGVSDEFMHYLAYVGSYAQTDTGALAVIHRDPTHGEIVGIKYRHQDGHKTSEPGSDFKSFLYQPYVYVAGTPACVITEGETDCWAWLAAAGGHVYSLPSGAGSWRDHFLEQLEPYDEIWLAFDNDKAGKDATDKVTRSIGWGRARFVQIPTFYKDVREAITAGWVPSTPVCSTAQYNTRHDLRDRIQDREGHLDRGRQRRHHRIRSANSPRRHQSVPPGHGMTFGFCGSFRMGQLLRFGLDKIEHPAAWTTSSSWSPSSLTTCAQRCESAATRTSKTTRNRVATSWSPTATSSTRSSPTSRLHSRRAPTPASDPAPTSPSGRCTRWPTGGHRRNSQACAVCRRRPRRVRVTAVRGGEAQAMSKARAKGTVGENFFLAKLRGQCSVPRSSEPR